MAYLHCHNCGWSQDDFWDKNYNVVRSLLDWEDSLLGEKFNEIFPGNSNRENNLSRFTFKEVIARELEHHANIIRNMKWRTDVEFQRDYKLGIAKCPHCGSKKDFDID
jgi:hypothetical protein